MADEPLGRLGNKLGPLPVWAWSAVGVGVIVGFAYWRKGRTGSESAAGAMAADSASASYGSTSGVSETGGGFASTGTGNGVNLGGLSAQLSAMQAQLTALSTQQTVGAKPGATSGVSGKSSRAGAGAAAGATMRARTLSQGARGADVKALQTSLANAGFNPGPIDSVFGSQTAAAVRAYQRSRGLSTDAIAGPQTLSALASGKGATATPATPAPGHPATGQTVAAPSLLGGGSMFGGLTSGVGPSAPVQPGTDSNFPGVTLTPRRGTSTTTGGI